jgi:hypothetical protein
MGTPKSGSFFLLGQEIKISHHGGTGTQGKSLGCVFLGTALFAGQWDRQQRRRWLPATCIGPSLGVPGFAGNSAASGGQEFEFRGANPECAWSSLRGRICLFDSAMRHAGVFPDSREILRFA